jgi:FtsP/CotA-like multicopper oxidase with cupredoxin domain
MQWRAELHGGLPSTGAHANQLWGDINVVNGVPWPVMDIQSTWHRFRVLNASPSRPWILQVDAVSCPYSLLHT